MPRLSDPDRIRWRDLWRTTVCEFDHDGTWLDFARNAPSTPTLLITAWNPGGVPSPAGENARRDAVLRDDLVALDLRPVRARGRSPDASWHEDGWAVPCQRDSALALLVRHGQLAAFVFARGGRGLLWRDGVFEWLEAPP